MSQTLMVMAIWTTYFTAEMNNDNIAWHENDGNVEPMDDSLNSAQS